MASSVAFAEWPDALRDLVPHILSYLATPDVIRCSGACALFREASKQLTASGSVRLDASWIPAAALAPSISWWDSCSHHWRRVNEIRFGASSAICASTHRMP